MNLPTCSACGQTFALVNHNTQAVPGYPSEPMPTTVPNTDAYGITHGTRRTTTQHWVRKQGPIPKVTTAPEGTDNVMAWNCPCGAIVQTREPALETVPCTHDTGTHAVCRVRAIQVSPPADRYVNARHGASCPCCGHQGTHEVRVDRQGPLPRCLRS